MQVCTSLQTDNHASTPPQFFTGRMPFLPPNQQRQSTEGLENTTTRKYHWTHWAIQTRDMKWFKKPAATNLFQKKTQHDIKCSLLNNRTAVSSRPSLASQSAPSAAARPLYGNHRGLSNHSV